MNQQTVIFDSTVRRQKVANGDQIAIFQRKNARRWYFVMVETGGDPGQTPSRTTYEPAGFEKWPDARYFRTLKKESRMKKVVLVAILLCAPATANDAPADHTLPELQKLYDEWRFSGAVRSGDHIYVSGVVGGIRDGETTPEAAFVRAFENIGNTLKLAGADWGDVVDITSFHTDVASQITLFRQVKDRYTVTKPYPAWTAIGVSRLITDKGVVEIKVVARIAE